MAFQFIPFNLPQIQNSIGNQFSTVPACANAERP